MKFFFPLLTILLLTQCQAQKVVATNMQEKEALPYHQIPDYPADYESGNVAARMVDGLGYRYYWATKDLRPEDLAYQPSADAQNAAQTMEHLYGLSLVIMNATKGLPNVRPMDFPDYSFEERRAATLRNLKVASDNLKGKKDKNLEGYTVIFQRGGNTSEFPFWNLINGPIADAIYHTGQIVSFRRTTGNPVQTGVNVFMGKTKE